MHLLALLLDEFLDVAAVCRDIGLGEFGYCARAGFLNIADDVVDALDDRLRGNAVLGVVGDLNLAATICFPDCAIEGARHMIGIEYHAAVDVARGATDRLDKRCLAAQESFFVGIEYANELDLRQVESFAQQVDADKHVEFSAAKCREYLDALDCLDVAVDVLGANVFLDEKLREIFGHLFGEYGDHRTRATLGDELSFTDKIFYLAGYAEFFEVLPCVLEVGTRDELSADAIPLTTGRMIISGSISPVGRMTWETRLAAALELEDAGRR